MKNFHSFIKEVFSFETVKYMGAGAVSGGSNFCLYYILKNLFKVNYLVSNFIAFTIGVIISYFLNKEFVFKKKEKENKESLKGFAEFTFSRIFTCICDMLLLYFLVDKIKMHSDIAKIVDSAVISVSNYLICKLFIFR